MRILQVHNHHVRPGGMEVLFAATVALLRERGHEVVTLERDNATIRGLGAKVRAFRNGAYSRPAARELRAVLRAERPEVAHLHNLYPLISPSALDACAEEGVPVVLACQDYRLTCPTAQHFRAGAVCHRCLGGREYHCIATNCRGSLPTSVAYAMRAAAVRRSRRFHGSDVARFLACSAFVRDRLAGEGYPAERIVVLPNMGRMPAAPPPSGHPRYVAFIGRISPEKGVDVLLAAAARCPGSEFRVAGDGPLLPALRASAPPNVHFVGPLRREALADFLAGALCLAVPSLFEEPFGIVAAEAMGHGVPVIASRTGGLPEVVADGETGLLFAPGDDAGLAAAVESLRSDPEGRDRMARAARARAVREFGSGAYYARLLRVYHEVVAEAQATPAVASRPSPDEQPAWTS